MPRYFIVKMTQIWISHKFLIELDTSIDCMTMMMSRQTICQNKYEYKFVCVNIQMSI